MILKIIQLSSIETVQEYFFIFELFILKYDYTNFSLMRKL